MKVRPAFVSNSSTSSFMMLAFDIADLCEKDAKKVTWKKVMRSHPEWNNIQKDIKEMMRHDDFDSEEEAFEELRYDYDSHIVILEDGEEGAPPGRKFVGITLVAGHSDDGGMTGTASGKDIQEGVKLIRDAVDLPKDLEWFIYCGTRSG